MSEANKRHSGPRMPDAPPIRGFVRMSGSCSPDGLVRLTTPNFETWLKTHLRNTKRG
jgi:hypothetical protein